MLEKYLQRLGPNYPLAAYCVTRAFAIGAGGGCVVYVNWTLGLTGTERITFTLAAWSAIGLAVLITLLLAEWMLHGCRVALTGDPAAETDEVLIQAALRQAVLFPRRIALAETLLDPWITIFPICFGLYLAGIAVDVLLQVCVAGFLGLASIILMTLLWMETALEPVIYRLLQLSEQFDFSQLPQSRLGRRLSLGFGVTILVTAIMIGGLGVQRAQLVVHGPAAADAATKAFQRQTVIITLAALLTGLAYSTLIARSVTRRVNLLVGVMREVEDGQLDRRVIPTGTDEIDRLARQFNVMVQRLAESKQELLRFNSQLEGMVADRTRELNQSLELLSDRNNALAEALNHVRQMQNQLVQSEKLVALGQLVAGLAHEVNNSINPICSGSQILKRRLDRIQQDAGPMLPAEATNLLRKSGELLEVITQGAERTARIVREMQRFSHPTGSGPVLLDLTAVIESAISLVCLQQRRVRRASQSQLPFSDALTEIIISTDYQHQTTCHGPYGALDQVFINILSNAVQALGAAGLIEIKTSETREAWHVVIRDSGPGIPPAIQHRIFEPFFTTKPPGEGTGLGLSICHSIITGLGGELTCTSSPGRGTAFVMIIPKEARTPESFPSKRPAADAN